MSRTGSGRYKTPAPNIVDLILQYTDFNEKQGIDRKACKVSQVELMCIPCERVISLKVTRRVISSTKSTKARRISPILRLTIVVNNNLYLISIINT